MSFQHQLEIKLQELESQLKDQQRIADQIKAIKILLQLGSDTPHKEGVQLNLGDQFFLPRKTTYPKQNTITRKIVDIIKDSGEPISTTDITKLIRNTEYEKYRTVQRGSFGIDQLLRQIHQRGLVHKIKIKNRNYWEIKNDHKKIEENSTQPTESN